MENRLALWDAYSKTELVCNYDESFDEVEVIISQTLEDNFTGSQGISLSLDQAKELADHINELIEKYQ